MDSSQLPRMLLSNNNKNPYSKLFKMRYRAASNGLQSAPPGLWLSGKVHANIYLNPGFGPPTALLAAFGVLVTQQEPKSNVMAP